MANTSAAAIATEKASAVGLKGHFTRARNAVNKLLQFIATNPSEQALRDLVQERDRAFAAHKKVEESLMRLQTIEPAKSKDYEDQLSELEDIVGEIRESVLVAISQANTSPAHATNEAPPNASSNQRSMPTDALKPFILKKDNNPVEFRSWVEKFKVYFQATNLGSSTTIEQQAYFKAYLDPWLVARISPSITATTKIFDENGCIDILESDFKERYPLFVRRVEFFRSNQKQGQPFSEWFLKLKQMGEEADLQSISIDDLYIMRSIQGTTDNKLRESFLQEPNLTVKSMEQIARAHEVARASVLALNPGARTAKTSFKKTSGKRKPIPPELLGKCLACGSSLTKHKFKDCPVRQKRLECRNCKKKGHLAKVCQQGQSRGQSRNTSKAPSTATSRDNSPQRQAETKVVKTASSPDEPAPMINIIVRARGATPFNFDALADSGSTRTIIAKDVARAYGLKIDRNRKIPIQAANSTALECLGSSVVQVEYGGIITEIDALISSSVRNEILLGNSDLKRMCILPQDFPEVVCRATRQPDKPQSSETETFEDLSSVFEKYPTVFAEGQLKTMQWPPMKIHLRNDIKVEPMKIFVARKIPIHHEEEANKEMDKLINQKILEKVDHPTEWVNPSMFVKKEGGGLRLVTDFSALNKYVKRPVHPFPTAQEVTQSIPADSKWFAKLDAVKGYHQINLDEESRDLTTILLPRGRYRYTRAPMGLSSSSDEFCARTDRALEGLEGVLKLVDDILIFAPDKEQLYTRLASVLQRCQSNGITLSRAKAKVAQEVKFAGFLISQDGIRADPEKKTAIAKFPVPQNISELRGFFGLANQLGQFLPDLAHATEPLRQLLRKDVLYQWMPEHQEAFKKTKELLTSDQVIKHFNPKLPTVLLTDASRLKGLGFALMQKEGDKWNLIQCGSRSLSATESRYATIELECLGIHYAISKCRLYLQGSDNFEVLTDHKPLIGIFKKSVAEIENPRLQRIREKLIPYNFTIAWTPGKTHNIADTLSRGPVFSPAEEEDQIFATCRAIKTSNELQDLEQAAQKDEAYQQMGRAFTEGKNPQELPTNHPAKTLRSVWDSVSQEGELLAVNGRILVPKSEREKILQLLHLPHCGITKTKQAARQLYYWDTLNNNIETMIEKCEECQQLRPSKPQEPCIMTVAERPMQKLSADLFEYAGKSYLCVADRYSGFPWVYHLKKTATSDVTAKLKELFQDWGIPEQIRTDGGPQFRSEFKEFCDDYKIEHEVSSPYHPQSNGHAEAMVKQMKNLLKKQMGNWELFKSALLEYRNVPRSDGLSPSQKMFGRRQRTRLPVLQQAHGIINMKDRKVKEENQVEEEEDQKEFQVGQRVRIQDPHTNKWDSFGFIKKSFHQKRSYEIEIDGKTFIRNRKFLKAEAERNSMNEEKHRSAKSGGKNSEVRRSARLQKKVVFDFS